MLQHTTPPPIRPRYPHHPENKDSLGFGRLAEGQLRPTLQHIKDRSLLSEPPPTPTHDVGIVISAGGKYQDWGLVNAKWCREIQKIQLPIQVWHLGPHEIQPHLHKHFKALDIELVDAFDVRSRHPHRALKGWSLKQFAAMRAPFQKVISLDADAFITHTPEFVLNDPEFISRGAFFCADVAPCRKTNWAYFFANAPVPEKEMESGFFAWDRSNPKVWESLQLLHWIAEHSELWDKHIYGDKDRAYLAFQNTQTPYCFADRPTWEGWGIRHYWRDTPICDHGMGWKRGEHAAPHPILPSLFEWVRSIR